MPPNKAMKLTKLGWCWSEVWWSAGTAVPLSSSADLGVRSPRSLTPVFGGPKSEERMRPEKVVAAFVDRINAHDVVGLAELMTESHVFVDALDNRTVGRVAMRTAWQQYFALVPGYWIKVDSQYHRGRTVALFGRAGGGCAADVANGDAGGWETPASWLAEVDGGHVAVWRVYADNLPLRQRMGGSSR